MRTIFLGLLAAAGIAIATSVVPASAQVTVDTPVGGVVSGVVSVRRSASLRFIKVRAQVYATASTTIATITQNTVSIAPIIEGSLPTAADS